MRGGPRQPVARSTVRRGGALSATPSRGGLTPLDAAIRPGARGGAPVHRAGRVMGVSAMIESPAAGFTGAGLVIPITQARAPLPHLEQRL
jgi:S1-C subfamily serine protease